jgi:hypothetical protein
VEVTVTREACPIGGGHLPATRGDVVSRTELPAHPRPHVTPYRVWGGRCLVCGPRCGASLRTGHGITPGRRPSRVRARVRAAAHAVPDGSGSPGCQVPMVLGASTGVRRPQGAITRDALPRAGGAMGRTDPQRRAMGPETPVVPTDDTGWDGGRPACLPEGVRDRYDDRRSIRSSVALATTKSRRSFRNVKFRSYLWVVSHWYCRCADTLRQNGAHDYPGERYARAHIGSCRAAYCLHGAG